MNKWGCLLVVTVVLFALFYVGIITTDMLLEWSETALTWLIDALTSLQEYLRTL